MDMSRAPRPRGGGVRFAQRAEAGIESAQLLRAAARLLNSVGVLRGTLRTYADSEKNWTVAQHLWEENGGFIRQP